MSRSIATICLLAITIFAATVVPVIQGSAQVERYFFEMTITAPLGFEPRLKAADVMKLELAKIGIKVKVENIDVSAMLGKVRQTETKGATAAEGGVDAYLWNIWNYRYDPSGEAYNYHSDPVGFPKRWSNARVDELFEKGQTILDVKERTPLYREIARILYDELPVIPMWYTSIPYVLNKNIENLDVDWDTSYDFRVMKIKGKTEADETRVVFAGPTGVRSFSDLFSGSGYDRRFYNILYDALIYDPDSLVIPKFGQKPLPGLAESWEVSPDGTVYTFKLRRGVKWHDGVEMTSEDFKVTADAIMDKETGARFYKTLVDNIKSVETPDKYTVVYRLKQPFAGAWSDLFWLPRVFPAHILKDVPHKDWAKHETSTSKPIGTGPYKLVKYVKDEYIEFEAFKDYFGGRPFVDKVFFRIIPDAAAALAAAEKGEVDILEGFYGYVKELKNLHPSLTYQTIQIHGSQSMIINTEHPILGNKYVRKAISHMVPRDHIVKDISGGLGVVATQQWAPMYWFADPDLKGWEYSIDKAKEYMVKAGFNYDWLKPPPEIPITTYLLPAVAGLIVGAAAGAVAMRVRRKP